MDLKARQHKAHSYQFPPLIKGRLIKRYKRFLADMEITEGPDTGKIITAHCPNSGSMLECSKPESPVYISFHDNPKRKLKYTWELIDMESSLVGVNTNVPNKLVKLSIEHQLVSELSGYESVKAEVKINKQSRLDILAESPGRRPCYVEVKNCTLVKDGHARFPDAVTTRGQKHLTELMQLVKENKRCAMFYLIQRMDAESFSPADDIDPEYGRLLRQARDSGVDIVVYDTVIDENKISIGKKIPLIL